VTDSSTAARRIPVVSIVAIVLAIVALIASGFALWPRASATDATPTPSASTGAADPRIVSESELRAFGADNSPVYWAGPDDGVEYELTRSADGTVFIRYLTGGAAAGDESDAFLSIATYPQVDGYTNLLQAAQIDGATSTVGSGGALIVTNPDVPNSAYFSFEGAQFQVEVYSPDAGAALSLVSDGTIEVLK
jgi:hypothetical protein